MQTRIESWGKSAAIRIPEDILREAGLLLGDDIEFTAEHGKVVINRSARKSFSLESLLDDMRPDQFHDETDWGPPVGNEFW